MNDTINTIKDGSISCVVPNISINGIDLLEMNFYGDISITYSEQLVRDKNGNEHTYHILHENNLVSELDDDMWFINSSLKNIILDEIKKGLETHVYYREWMKEDPLMLYIDADKYRMEINSNE